MPIYALGGITRYSGSSRSPQFRSRMDSIKRGFLSANLQFSGNRALRNFTLFSFESPKRFEIWQNLLQSIGNESDRRIEVVLPKYEMLLHFGIEDLPLDAFKIRLSASISNIGRNRTLDLKGIQGFERELRLYYKPVNGESLPVQTLGVSIGQTSFSDTVSRSVKVVTEDLLVNSDHPLCYTDDPLEYSELVHSALGEHGIFKGDRMAVPLGGPFMQVAAGSRIYTIKRLGETLDVEVFNAKAARNVIGNRMVFELDRLIQKASFDKYQTKGVSYERSTYYDNRLLNCDHVIVIRWKGMPVSFAAVSENEMVFMGKKVKYAFIHYVMTMGRFQRQGLTAHALKEVLSSVWLRNSIRNFLYESTGWSYDSDGRERLKKTPFELWVVAHSGKFPVYEAFTRSFDLEGFNFSNPDPLRAGIILDADKRITLPSERATRSLDLNTFVDHGVYTENTRYPVDGDGRIVFPVDESSEGQVFYDWLGAIGGEEGLREGNGLYFIGKVTNRVRRTDYRDISMPNSRIGRQNS